MLKFLSFTLYLKVLLMEEKDLYAELSSIRNLMERSSKFISLSGLSGIMAGIYSLVGAYTGYKFFYKANSITEYSKDYAGTETILWQPVLLIAIAVIVLSVVTGFLLTIRQAKKRNEKFWNPISKRLLTSAAIPLCTGGAFIFIILLKGNYETIAPCCLLFYGLALVASSEYTFTDIKWLGYCEIILGLLAALLPDFGFLCWIIGFGFLHIIYGSIMHFKYNQ